MFGPRQLQVCSIVGLNHLPIAPQLSHQDSGPCMTLFKTSNLEGRLLKSNAFVWISFLVGIEQAPMRSITSIDACASYMTVCWSYKFCPDPTLCDESFFWQIHAGGKQHSVLLGKASTFETLTFAFGLQAKVWIASWALSRMGEKDNLYRSLLDLIRLILSYANLAMIGNAQQVAAKVIRHLLVTTTNQKTEYIVIGQSPYTWPDKLILEIGTPFAHLNPHWCPAGAYRPSIQILAKACLQHTSLMDMAEHPKMQYEDTCKMLQNLDRIKKTGALFFDARSMSDKGLSDKARKDNSVH